MEWVRIRVLWDDGVDVLTPTWMEMERKRNSEMNTESASRREQPLESDRGHEPPKRIDEIALFLKTISLSISSNH